MVVVIPATESLVAKPMSQLELRYAVLLAVSAFQILLEVVV
jgi:hypothetical protein